MVNREQQGGTAMAPPSPSIHAAAAWSTSAEYLDPATLFHSSLPSFMSPAADGDPPTSLASFQPHNPCSPGSLHDDFLDSLQPNGGPQTTIKTNGTMPWGREEDGGDNRTDSSDINMSATLTFSAFRGESDHHRHRGHGYADVTAPSTAGGNTITSSSATLHDAAATATAVATTPAPRGTETGDNLSAPVAGMLAEFSSSVFQSQAEIAGMSSAVADYIAWMRKVPAGTAPPNTIPVFVNVLEAVESRLREMREIAQTRPRAAFRDMVAALQSLGPAGASVCNSLAHLEKEFDQQSADVANFFQTRYNACATLSEQVQNIPHTPSSIGRESNGSGNSTQRTR